MDEVINYFKIFFNGHVSTVLFHKYGGANVGVTNFMSHFSMSVGTKANVKLANDNMLHAQVIGIVVLLTAVLYIQ